MSELERYDLDECKWMIHEVEEWCKSEDVAQLEAQLSHMAEVQGRALDEAAELRGDLAVTEARIGDHDVALNERGRRIQELRKDLEIYKNALADSEETKIGLMQEVERLQGNLSTTREDSIHD